MHGRTLIVDEAKKEIASGKRFGEAVKANGDVIPMRVARRFDQQTAAGTKIITTCLHDNRPVNVASNP
jgi:hypothetical protein